MIKRLIAVTLSAAVLGLALVAPSAGAAKVDPENDNRPPDADAGMFLGYAAPTYSWHGCTRTATAKTLTPVPVSGAPALSKGTKQKAIDFKVRVGTPYLSWKVAKDKWKICGVQASVVLHNPNVSSDLYAEVGYTSGGQKGSTVTSGKETIRVKIPKKGIGAGFEQFEGKTFSIQSIHHVAVFVKKKK